MDIKLLIALVSIVYMVDAFPMNEEQTVTELNQYEHVRTETTGIVSTIENVTLTGNFNETSNGSLKQNETLPQNTTYQENSIETEQPYWNGMEELWRKKRAAKTRPIDESVSLVYEACIVFFVLFGVWMCIILMVCIAACVAGPKAVEKARRGGD